MPHFPRVRSIDSELTATHHGGDNTLRSRNAALEPRLQYDDLLCSAICTPLSMHGLLFLPCLLPSLRHVSHHSVTTRSP
ncbi:hypothetical protein E2C01_092396 [Portunus trituberculatus]|uniref:Uncharacterized protein n=1 Tax=Portunus trituberculatus TaxID=210409 RepID=A0A5B7JRM1_PORTR|nr:hypothetical protein [Portunus trituberculatus]